MSNPALHLNSVCKSFDGNHALTDAFFSSDWGEVHALLGENGAGKSTLMNIVSGLYNPDKGIIKIDGDEVVIDGPSKSQALGIGMVHQHFKLVSNMTVLENIMLSIRNYRWRLGKKAALKAIANIPNQIGFALDPEARIDSLSVSEQQRVEISKALIGGAKILILDEPTAVLTDDESDKLLEALKLYAAKGRSVIVITHKLREVLKHTDRVTVMRSGRTVESGKDTKTMSADKLSYLMVGEAKEYKRREQPKIGSELLAIERVEVIRENGSVALNEIEFKVNSGEIYGVAGIGGNGQTELAEILMGIRSFNKGSIFFNGNNINNFNSDRLRRLGINSIPADRYNYAIAGDLTVMENFAVSRMNFEQFGNFAWIDWVNIEKKTNSIIIENDIQGAKPNTKARLLSGGNAQKLVLARELTNNSKLLIAHSPTRGLDVRACVAVHEGLRKAANKGAAVILISEDLDEILSVSDRIGVINDGIIVGEFDVPADRQQVAKLMVDNF